MDANREERLNAILEETAAKQEAEEAPAQPEETEEPSSEVTELSGSAEKSEPTKKSESAAVSFFDDLMEMVEAGLIAVFIVMNIFAYLICVANVDGDSMVPTLNDNDRLLVNRISRDYDRGDILIVNCDHAYLFEDGQVVEKPGIHKRVVKRLIAKAGQEIDIDFAAGIVYVDGEALDEPYVNDLTKRDNYAFTYPFVIPEGYVFVLGDNRSISKDSRHRDIGLVPEGEIIGSVILRFLPWSDFMIVH